MHNERDLIITAKTLNKHKSFCKFLIIWLLTFNSVALHFCADCPKFHTHLSVMTHNIYAPLISPWSKFDPLNNN